jgi:hypothetical protein
MTHGFRLHIMLLTLFVIAALNMQAQGLHARLSTPEERARAVAFASRFEKDPFVKDENNDEDWLRKWLDEVSDVDPFACRTNYAELVNARDPISGIPTCQSSNKEPLLCRDLLRQSGDLGPGSSLVDPTNGPRRPAPSSNPF